MHTSMRAYKHVCAQACMHTGMYAYKHECTQACMHTSMHLPHSVISLPPPGTYFTDEVGDVRGAGGKHSMRLWRIAEGGIPAQGWPAQRAAGGPRFHWVAQLVYVVSILCAQ